MVRLQDLEAAASKALEEQSRGAFNPRRDPTRDSPDSRRDKVFLPAIRDYQRNGHFKTIAEIAAAHGLKRDVLKHRIHAARAKTTLPRPTPLTSEVTCCACGKTESLFSLSPKSRRRAVHSWWQWTCGEACAEVRLQAWMDHWRRRRQAYLLVIQRLKAEGMALSDVAKKLKLAHEKVRRIVAWGRSGRKALTRGTAADARRARTYSKMQANGMSNAKIAKECGVSAAFVARSLRRLRKIDGEKFVPFVGWVDPSGQASAK